MKDNTPIWCGIAFLALNIELLYFTVSSAIPALIMGAMGGFMLGVGVGIKIQQNKKEA